MPYVYIKGVRVRPHPYDVHIGKTLIYKGESRMSKLKKLDELLLMGVITVDEYKEKRDTYIERIYHLYLKGWIDIEELKERLK